MSEKDIVTRLRETQKAFPHNVFGQIWVEAADEIEQLGERIERQGKEIKRLRELLERVIQLHAACNDLVESAQGGNGYGEVICDIDDFNAVEKLLPTDNQEKKA